MSEGTVMKKILFMFLVAMFSLSLFLPIKEVKAEAKTEHIEVYHLFTHALVAYPEIAFAKDNVMAEHYDRDCLTVNEFKKILFQLYTKNFILVSTDDLYYFDGKKLIFKNTNFGDKKPLLLSFDDINYYTKKMNLGMNDKIILANNTLATYTKDAKSQINYDNEVITILENFIRKHPDFSFNNAKGTICLTGFDGVLGYRTQKKSQDRTQEIAKVLPVVNKLKELNWKFACHSYGHYHMKSISYDTFKQDTDCWLNEVQSIIGKTDIYCYPFGEYDIEDNNCISRKQKYLLDCGFKMYWGVGGKVFWSDMPKNKNITTKFAFMDRIAMDGYTLRYRDMSQFYNNLEVWDKQRPSY